MSNKPKVFVAMSGGVDSSVTALLLKNDGYDVTGVHMLCWEGCENNEDRRDAMRVAAVLDIPFLVWDFKKEYRETVFDYMVREYAAGRTPNPDVMCNSRIKFGVFLERALKEGADYIATGHYVKKFEARNPKLETKGEETHPPTPSLKVREGERGRVILSPARDLNKDQSYFLWTLTQNQLQYCFFPIGNYLKSEVREMALEAGLPVAAKPDSQGLCFVGKVDFQDFLRGFIPVSEGQIVTSEGQALGRHDGAHFYTIGQRHGLNLGGQLEPVFVAEKNAATNTLIVARGADDPILYKKELIAENVNWISNEPNLPLECLARIRYRQPLQAVKVICKEVSNLPPNPLPYFKGGGKKERSPSLLGGWLRLTFEVPQRAVAPGQSVVFYLPAEASAKAGDGEEMLGGGIING